MFGDWRITYINCDGKLAERVICNTSLAMLGSVVFNGSVEPEKVIKAELLPEVQS